MTRERGTGTAPGRPRPGLPLEAGRSDAGPGVAVGPGITAGALIARDEAHAASGRRAADLRIGEPARFPAGPGAVAGPRPDGTSHDLYIELI